MSVVVLQLGQCGNQVGLKLFETLAHHASITTEQGRRTREQFFRPTVFSDEKNNEAALNTSQTHSPPCSDPVITKRPLEAPSLRDVAGDKTSHAGSACKSAFDLSKITKAIEKTEALIDANSKVGNPIAPAEKLARNAEKLKPKVAQIGGTAFVPAKKATKAKIANSATTASRKPTSTLSRRSQVLSTGETLRKRDDVLHKSSSEAKLCDALNPNSRCPDITTPGSRPLVKLLVARAILVDTEKKVISHVTSEARKWTREGSDRRWKWCYAEKGTYCHRAGAGNNWAYGYSVHGPPSYAAVRNQIKREVKLCNEFGGFLILQSLAGGTGSGLGSYFTEQLRKDFPEATIFNQVVWPYTSGEVIVQNYNAIHTVARLHLVSNAILGLRNDHLHRICIDRLGYKHVTFAQLNQLVATLLTGLLLPTSRVSSAGRFTGSWSDSANDAETLKRSRKGHRDSVRFGGGTEWSDLKELLDHLTPESRFKLLSIKYVPQLSSTVLGFSNHSWPSLLRPLFQMSITDAPTDERLDWSVKPSPTSSTSSRQNSRAPPSASPPESASVSLTSNSISSLSSSSSTSLTAASTLPSALISKKSSPSESTPASISASTLSSASHPSTNSSRKLHKSLSSLLILRGIGTCTEEAKTACRNSFFDTPSAVQSLIASDPKKSSRNAMDVLTDADAVEIALRSHDGGIWKPRSHCFAQVIEHPVLVVASGKEGLVSMMGDKAAYVVSNSSAFLDPLETMLRHATTMFESGAYVHQYYKYGLTKQDFSKSFEIVKKVIGDYRCFC